MSAGNKTRAPDAPPLESMPFEEALGKLEAIVDAMETGELPLETLLVKYEEGTRLAQVCQAKLADAELKIQKLEQGAELAAKAWSPSESTP